MSFTAFALILFPFAFAEVVAVHDVDTVTIRTLAGEYHVRVLLMDGPELAQHPWGEAAKWYATAQLQGRPIVPVLDRVKPDPYGRLLAHLIDERGSYAERTVRAGWAWHYNPGRALAVEPAVIAAEAQAKSKGRGIWRPGVVRPQRASEFRRALRAKRKRAGHPS